MKISIVTISYNQVKFLARCIDSVLLQQKTMNTINVELEYIVIDPGSTDGSRNLINSYGNKIIKIFEPDNGPADGLATGFSIVTGDVLGYLNSDDILYDKALFYVANYFLKHKNTDVLSGGANLIGPNDEVYRKLYSDSFNLSAAAYGASILIQPSSFFRKDIFLKTNGFNIYNKTNWDGELFIDMALLGAQFETKNKILSGYRVHDESITGSMSTANKMQKYRDEIFCKITGKDIKSYSILSETYFRIRRKILNYGDTIERIRGGRSFGRAL